MLVSVATNIAQDVLCLSVFVARQMAQDVLWQSCLLQAQCCALRRLCLKEGVEESKIDQIVQLDEYVVSTYRCLCTHFCA